MRIRKSSVIHSKISSMLHVEQIIPSEEDECITFYDYTQIIPAIKDYTVHFANEGKRSGAFGRRLKRFGGLPKGFPDFCIFIPNLSYHSLFIEMKTIDERHKKQKKEQLMWIARLLKAGHYATMCYGCDDGIQVVNRYLNNKL